jgi:hypothetical protein
MADEADLANDLSDFYTRARIAHAALEVRKGYPDITNLLGVSGTYLKRCEMVFRFVLFRSLQAHRIEIVSCSSLPRASRRAYPAEVLRDFFCLENVSGKCEWKM